MANDSNQPERSADTQSAQTPEVTAKDLPQSAHERRVQVEYSYSDALVPILQHIKSSLLVTTYAAGKLLAIGARDDSLQIDFSNYMQAMGMAAGRSTIAIGGRNIVWMLQNGGALAGQISPAGQYDICYLSREAFITGEIHCHELAWSGDNELWVVNTLFSCLCTLHADFNFVPRWQPKFISELAAEDRCHLNGLAMVDAQPRFASAMGETDAARGWREHKASGGIIIDIPSNEIVARGLCMPHSPRWYLGKLWALDSGKGQLVTIDISNGQVETVVEIPAYVRGLAFCGQFAFVGMSQARERSVFGGVPICDDQRRDQLRCGVAVVDLNSGTAVAFLQFKTGIGEIFDVQVLPGYSSPFLSGPYPQDDESIPVWVVPEPGKVKSLMETSELGSVARAKRK